jgi:hypothetical protein
MAPFGFNEAFFPNLPFGVADSAVPFVQGFFAFRRQKLGTPETGMVSMGLFRPAQPPFKQKRCFAFPAGTPFSAAAFSFGIRGWYGFGSHPVILTTNYRPMRFPAQQPTTAFSMTFIHPDAPSAKALPLTSSAPERTWAYALSLLLGLLCLGSPLWAQHHNHDHGGHQGHDHDGHGHPNLLLTDLLPLEEWAFETGEGLEPTQVRFVWIGDSWLLQGQRGDAMENKRFLPFGIAEAGMEQADLDPHKTYVVEGHMGIVPPHIRMLGTPLKVSRILLLQQAQQGE